MEKLPAHSLFVFGEMRSRGAASSCWASTLPRSVPTCAPSHGKRSHNTCTLKPLACAALMMSCAQVLAAVSQSDDASVRQEAAGELSELLNQPLATWAASAGFLEKKP